MHWKLFANLAEEAGQKEVDIEAAGTVGEALDALFERHPGLEELVRAEDGSVADHIRLLVDGEDPFATASGIETPLDEDTELALFPPVSGG